MQKTDDRYRSILIVSSSERFDLIVKRSLSGFITIDIRRSAAQARRCILERRYDIVAVNVPLPDETGEDLAVLAAEKCDASVLAVVPQDVFEEVFSRVTDHGVLVVPKPSPRGRIDKALRFLAAVQDRIRDQEQKRRSAEEKLEEMRIVSKAKLVLVEKRHMTEEEAHRLIGKLAMDNGISRGRAAESILDDLE